MVVVIIGFKWVKLFMMGMVCGVGVVMGFGKK